MSNANEMNELLNYIDGKIAILSPKVEQLIQYTVQVGYAKYLTIIVVFLICLSLVFYLGKKNFSIFFTDKNKYSSKEEEAKKNAECYILALSLAITMVLAIVIFDNSEHMWGIYVDPEMWAIKEILRGR
jgi:hypothetical protein